MDDNDYVPPPCRRALQSVRNQPRIFPEPDLVNENVADEYINEMWALMECNEPNLSGEEFSYFSSSNEQSNNSSSNQRRPLCDNRPMNFNLEQLLANQRYPAANQRSPAANQRYPANQRHPANQRSPPANQRSCPNRAPIRQDLYNYISDESPQLIDSSLENQESYNNILDESPYLVDSSGSEMMSSFENPACPKRNQRTVHGIPVNIHLPANQRSARNIPRNILLNPPANMARDRPVNRQLEFSSENEFFCDEESPDNRSPEMMRGRGRFDIDLSKANSQLDESGNECRDNAVDFMTNNILDNISISPNNGDIREYTIVESQSIIMQADSPTYPCPYARPSAANATYTVDNPNAMNNIRSSPVNRTYSIPNSNSHRSVRFPIANVRSATINTTYTLSNQGCPLKSSSPSGNTTYNVNEPCSPSANTTYNVNKPCSSSTNTTYNVNKSCPSSTNTTYNVNKPCPSSTNTTYNVNKPCPSSANTTYSVNKPCTSSANTTYNVNKSCTSSANTTYNVNKPCPPSANTTYNVNKPANTTHNVNKPCTSSANTTYNVKKPCPPSANTTYNVNKPCPPSANTTYNVHRPANTTYNQPNRTYRVEEPTERSPSKYYDFSGNTMYPCSQDMSQDESENSTLGIPMHQRVQIIEDLANRRNNVEINQNIQENFRVIDEVIENINVQAPCQQQHSHEISWRPQFTSSPAMPRNPEECPQENVVSSIVSLEVEAGDSDKDEITLVSGPDDLTYTILLSFSPIHSSTAHEFIKLTSRDYEELEVLRRIFTDSTEDPRNLTYTVTPAKS